MEPALDHLRSRIAAAHAERTPLRLRGAGTKDFYGEGFTGTVLDTRAYRGIVSYEPTELVLSARCGTPLSEIERALAERNQYLAFEPPAFGADPSIGGVVAAGLSGPRRASAGALRDYVLGASLVDGSGELLRFGGQVMKNVAGFDVSRLLCGSLGVLGLIAEVTLKVLPRPRLEQTLAFELPAAPALELFQRNRAQPLPLSGQAWAGGRALLRLSGAASAVASARARLGGELLDEAAAADWWCGLRDHALPLFRSAGTLWRLSLPSNAPMENAGVELIDWGGALHWLRSEEPAGGLRARVAALGGSAMRWSGVTADASMFHPLQPVNLELHRRLKQRFDPHGIFNPGRLATGL